MTTARRVLSAVPWAIGSAMVVGFLLRLAWVLWVTVTPEDPNSDTAQLLSVARQFADFDTMRLNGHVTAFYPPGYPLLLVPVVWLSEATGWFDLPLGAAFVNLVAATATIGLGAVLARRWFGPVEAAVAAWILALSPGHVFLTSAALSETVATALVLAALVLISRVIQETDPPARSLLVGIAALGAALVLIRTPAGVVVVIVAAVAVARRFGGLRAAARPLALLVVVLGALLVPWTVRNGLQVGVWTPAATSNAAFLCQGHKDDAEIVTTELDEEDTFPCFDGTPFAPEPDEAAWYGRTVREAVAWALTHPVEEADLTWDKTVLLLRDNSQALSDGQDFGNQETVPPGTADRLRDLTNLWHRSVLLAGAVGLLALPLARRAWPLWSTAAALVAVVWGGIPVDRFHHAPMALWSVFAAATLVAVGRWASAGIRDRVEGDGQDHEDEPPPPPVEGLAQASRPRSRVGGPGAHPFLPVLLGTATGAWASALAFDAVSFVSSTEWVYARGAWLLTGIGVAVGLVASFAALSDLLGIPRGTIAFRVGVRRLLALDVALVLFTVSFLVRNASDFAFHDPSPVLAVVLSVLGLAALAVTHWLGGTLTYRYGVRVALDEERLEGFEPADPSSGSATQHVEHRPAEP